MSTSSNTIVPDPTGSQRRSVNATLKRVFIGEQGIRSGWSALIFIAVFWLLQTSVLAILGHFISLDATRPIPMSLGLLQESCQVLVAAAATLVMARIENRPLLAYGFTGDRTLVRLLTGALWGFLCLSLLIGILWKAGLLVLERQLLSGFMAWRYAFAWGLVFLLVGVFEESLFRGYLQYAMTRGVGFWWAALLLSLAFAAGHLGNNGESILGIVEVFAAGLFFCLSLWYTKSLLWAVGFHAGWDWGQSYFYGTADSGLVMQNHFLASHASGNPLWSGGTTGPEGSLMMVPLLAVMGIGMWLWWGRIGNCCR
jgi:membrane protease YdiL (CAAX protease family)